jgi:hypothetical protein
LGKVNVCVTSVLCFDFAPPIDALLKGRTKGKKNERIHRDVLREERGDKVSLSLPPYFYYLLVVSVR